MPEFNTKRWFDITPLDGEIWRGKGKEYKVGMMHTKYPTMEELNRVIGL